MSKTRDKAYLLLGVRSTDTGEVRYLRANQPQGKFAVFLPREKKATSRYWVSTAIVEPNL